MGKARPLVLEAATAAVADPAVLASHDRRRQHPPGPAVCVAVPCHTHASPPLGPAVYQAAPAGTAGCPSSCLVAPVHPAPATSAGRILAWPADRLMEVRMPDQHQTIGAGHSPA